MMIAGPTLAPAFYYYIDVIDLPLIQKKSTDQGEEMVDSRATFGKLGLALFDQPAVLIFPTTDNGLFLIHSVLR